MSPQGTAEKMWPLSANILDPVRASIVCSSPGHMIEVAEWFCNSNLNHQSKSVLQVLKVKNKFSHFRDNVSSMYNQL